MSVSITQPAGAGRGRVFDIVVAPARHQPLRDCGDVGARELADDLRMGNGWITDDNAA